jgi:hypothetical protein
LGLLTFAKAIYELIGIGLTHPKKWILGHSEGSFFGGPLIRGEDGSVAQEHCPPFPVFINATVWRKLSKTSSPVISV